MFVKSTRFKQVYQLLLSLIVCLFHSIFFPQRFRVRTCKPWVQVATPLFSLLSPERSSLAVFAGVQGVVQPLFHVSFKVAEHSFASGQRQLA